AFDGPVIAVFQPHRYTRTRYLANDFARALAGADRVVVTDIYSASEDPIAGVSAASILEPLRAGGTAADHVPNVADAPAHVLRTAPPGALVLFLGAGSISQAAHDLARELESAPVP
ncbi:MAG: UDP-N-acetylmuramate--L-alanine ligase, partial [Candidatus Eremiobacteraeota bacterium]|nr:UDP-N-acetylmuramate--L-alanine ligase [Candidatus Eremiobacteraeota bacterium]